VPRRRSRLRLCAAVNWQEDARMVGDVSRGLRLRLAAPLVVVAIASCGPATASPATNPVAPPSSELIPYEPRRREGGGPRRTDRIGDREYYDIETPAEAMDAAITRGWTLGPMTNLADALGRRPNLAQRLESVYATGGARSSPATSPSAARPTTRSPSGTSTSTRRPPRRSSTRGSPCALSASTAPARCR
jgi:hypothetical protein